MPEPLEVGVDLRKERARSLLRELVLRRILFQRQGKAGGKSEYRLPARSFQEYLAARALAELIEHGRSLPCPPGNPWAPRLRRDNVDSFLGEVILRPDWEGVLLFLAGLLRDPHPLLVHLGQAGCGQTEARLRVLLGQCLAEVRADPQLSDGRLRNGQAQQALSSPQRDGTGQIRFPPSQATEDSPTFCI
jgi:hypothetical protein